MDDKEHLEHIGVLGMKWGHRKAKTITPSSVVESPNSDDHNKKLQLRGKRINEMTNDEIRNYVQRVSLEKQFKELTKPKLSPGKQYVKDLITNVGKSTLENYLKKYANQQVENLIKKSTKAKV